MRVHVRACCMAEGWRLQRLLFASFSVLEKMVFSEHQCQAPFRLPALLPPPFHTQIGSGLAVVLYVDKSGKLTVCCRFLCLNSSGSAASGRESFPLWLLVTALLKLSQSGFESQQPK